MATVRRAGPGEQDPVLPHPGGAHSRYYEWPGQPAPPATRAGTSARPDAGQVGLKAFLAWKPLTQPKNPQPATAAAPTLFSAIGSEEFAAEELATWLRHLRARDYQEPPFEESCAGSSRSSIAAQGVEPFVSGALARFQKGELSTLDQNALLAALELHPEAGGEAATAFLSRITRDARPRRPLD